MLQKQFLFVPCAELSKESTSNLHKIWVAKPENAIQKSTDAVPQFQATPKLLTWRAGRAEHRVWGNPSHIAKVVLNLAACTGAHAQKRI